MVRPKIQERALRFIYEDCSSSYEDLLNKSRLPTLKIRRLRTMAIEAYKILNKKSPMYLNDLFVFRKTMNTVEVPQVRTTYHGLHSFRCAGATLWNELPNELRKVSSLSQFKSLINSWSGGSCRCGSCKS